MQKAVEEVASTQLDSQRRLKAIALIAIAVSLFTCLDTSAKYVTTRAGIPVLQVVWLRFSTQLLVMIMFLGLVRVPALFVTQKLGHQLLRSCLLAGSTLFNFAALQYLRLDQTMPMFYLMPLMVALLAGPLLGEWVGWRRMLAIVVGFLGVVVVVRPGFLGFHWAFGLAAAGTLCYALYNISTRYLASYAAPEVTLFYGLLVPVIALAPVAYSQWVWPADLFTWLPIMLTGACGGLGHYLLIRAHEHAPASTLAPFTYLNLIAVVSLGYLVFGDLPDLFTLLGSAIIIASGLYLIHRERVVRQARSAPQPAVPAVPQPAVAQPASPRPPVTGPLT